MFENKIILVTGGTGSWGYELVKQLLKKNPKEIRIFSRNENNQVTMKRTFESDPRLTFIIGDVKEQNSVFKACENVDIIFHLAALKHVTVCEEQPYEALKTNVHGTQNVIDGAIANQVKKVIYVSTDKAANPSNFYGFTKSIGEKLAIHANILGANTKFVCIRAGNVLGSNGSVIHIFKKQIKEREKITITHKEMTRFFLNLEDAISLLFKAAEDSKGGEIFVMKMPACHIVDLAEVLAENHNVKEIEMEELGIRPGEKLHEILFSEYESQNTVTYDSNYYVILPFIHIKGLNDHYRKYEQANLTSYKSSDYLMSKEEIKEMLKKGKFIP
ncbi:UDP-N-acetylglucosamine 4,6-dehydratase [Pueribacillus theae]|uniref:UDP-N-acetylglucosamine 4,6-dehydratase n=1 Tax=Pueribacillus theae TaxID=2171751 RepID=A0A2U1K6D5_9BACI|nr:polysaccharide biosynthesis protein [Pueribacillus theae]PWA12719.1 UDP-N-acetylglucosamine 4,6-dehydratase [Pueribacillus theae]